MRVVIGRKDNGSREQHAVEGLEACGFLKGKKNKSRSTSRCKHNK